ncbi:CARDB protein [Candidatus Methanophagaceae archaeon]|nr:CARDB protein [Methanophagales archaeon]
MSPAITQSSISQFDDASTATNGEADDISEHTSTPSPPPETTPVLSPTPEQNSSLSPMSNQTQTSTPSPSPSPTPTQTLSHASPASTLFAPSSPVLDAEEAPRTLNITTNQSVNVSRLLNDTEVFNQSNVTRSSYTNTSAMTGTWNVSAIASNENGTDVQTGTWNVSDEQAIPAQSPTLHINEESLNVTESPENETQTLNESNTNLTTDLAVTSIELETGCGASEHPCFRYAGYALNVTATIVNLGVANASNFVVKFRDEGSQFNETEVSHLPAGSSCSVNAPWDL